jgi:hypothetical protein
MDPIVAAGSVSGELLGEPSPELQKGLTGGPGAALLVLVDVVAS